MRPCAEIRWASSLGKHSRHINATTKIGKQPAHFQGQPILELQRIWGGRWGGGRRRLNASDDEMMSIVVRLNPTTKNVLFALALALILGFSVLCFLAGNLIATFPYAVSVDKSEGLELFAPLKKLNIPIKDIRDVRESFIQQGYVMRPKRRRRLLTSFVIHRFFGEQGEPLADAIQEAIRRSAL